MDTISYHSSFLESDSILAGGGEMGRLMREHDWASTPLGPVEAWPQSLRTAVSICLASHFPMLIWWGPDLVKLYNDAYRPMLLQKHPKALGQRGRECWPEIWDIIGPMLEGVLTRGEATWSENQLLPLERNGFAEECYFTFSYSPIRDESGGIGGVFTAVTETTRQVLGERRLRILRELATETAEAHSLSQVCQVAAERLSGNPADLPFALLYLLSPDGKQACLAGSAGLPSCSTVSPERIDLDDETAAWSFPSVVEAGAPVLIDDLAGRYAEVAGYFSSHDAPPPRSALALPIIGANLERLYGFLVAGISPYRPLDDEYRGFLTLVAGQIATSCDSARAYQDAQERAAALAEIDRAKTAFFSNVSHEFRTPLTLSLGPLEAVLADTEHALTEEQRRLLEMVRRNELRQLKLVNTLLDFSRIEAGRIDATYVPTDLSALTADLASSFRSILEHAGLQLIVECAPLPEPVYVDRDMWEKIVLNLLSNAFKFTFRGYVRVALEAVGDAVELRVEDTGVGIRADDLPHLFERFYRAHSIRSRAYEGSGIGLALVQELVRLQGGSITVESVEGAGSSFIVRLPGGNAHLPAERLSDTHALSSTALGTDLYIEEAMRWLPETTHPVDEMPSFEGLEPSSSRAATGLSDGQSSLATLSHLLVVDDNADMRDYLKRILSPAYRITLANDGKQALDLIRTLHPDLVISDVMMPGLDGFALLAALRDDPATHSLPIILLSARAGEEATLAGIQAGADDYLVKPFSTRELLVRVQARLEIARLRAEAEAARQRLHDLFMQAPALICLLRGPEHVFELANPRYQRIVGRQESDLIGKPIREALPELEGQGFFELLDQVYASGEPFIGSELPVSLNRHRDGTRAIEIFNFVYQPARNARGEIDGILVHAVEVTEQVRASHLAQEREERLVALLESAGEGIYGVDTQGNCTFINRAGAAMFGYEPEELRGKLMHEIVHHHRSDGTDYPRSDCPILQALVTGEGIRVDSEVFWRRDGGSFPIEYASYPIRMSGKIVGAVVTFMDVSERKDLEQRKDAFIGMASHELRTPITSMKGNLQLAERRIARLVQQSEKLPGEGNKLIDEIAALIARSMRQIGVQTRLINDLLDVSRLQANKLELFPSLCDLVSIVRETVADQRAATPNRALLFEQEHAEPLFVMADADRIGQVVSNYLTNAIKYSPSSEPVEVGLSAYGRDARVWVRDRGPGLSREQQQQVWERFYQVPGLSVQSGSGQGLGLGLYICQTLISRHDGQVGVESVKGKGSTFWFTLPLADPHTQPVID